MSAILGATLGLVLGGGLSTVVARGVVQSPAPPELIVKCVHAWLKDNGWRDEQLRLAAVDAVPDEPAYWTPASLTELAALAHEEHLYASLRQQHTGRPGMDVIVTRSYDLTRRAPRATLIGASA